MPRRDTLAAPDTAPAVTDDLVTIEAPTVEEAMARLASELGDDARIVSAEKAARGGIGGFFAKETVILTARRPEHDRSSLPGVLERMTTDADLQERAFGDVLRRELEDRNPSSGLGSLLDAAGWSSRPDAGRRHDGHDSEDEPIEQPLDGFDGTPAGSNLDTAPAPVTVGPLVSRPEPVPPGPMHTASIVERLRHEHLVANPPAALTAPGIVVPGLSAALGSPLDRTVSPSPAVAPTGTPPSPSVPAPSDKSATADPAGNPTDLVRQGLPGAVVAAMRGIDPSDDMSWMTAMRDAIAPWCGPLPVADSVIVGVGADRLATELGLPLIGLGDVAPYEGTFCSVLTGARDDRAWLEFVRGNRSLHLVLDDDGRWRDFLVADPDVVSWVGGDALVDALYLASTLGSTLGYGVVEPAARMLRARSFDVALDVRRIVRSR